MRVSCMKHINMMISLPKVLIYQCSILGKFSNNLLKCRAKPPLLPLNSIFFNNFNSEMAEPISSKISQNICIYDTSWAQIVLFRSVQ